jgi:hypothetical protein
MVSSLATKVHKTLHHIETDEEMVCNSGYSKMRMRILTMVYARLDAYLPDRNQWHSTQAKIHYGSAELVPGGLGPTDWRTEL